MLLGKIVLRVRLQDLVWQYVGDHRSSSAQLGDLYQSSERRRSIHHEGKFLNEKAEYAQKSNSVVGVRTRYRIGRKQGQHVGQKLTTY